MCVCTKSACVQVDGAVCLYTRIQNNITVAVSARAVHAVCVCGHNNGVMNYLHYR